MAKKKSDFIDISALLALYKRKWYWFLISVLICGTLAVIFAKVSQPRFKVAANVLISQENGGGLSNFGGLGDLFGSTGYVDDEIFVITSHTVLRDVVRDLGLNRKHIIKTGLLTKVEKYVDTPVEVFPAPGIVDTLRTTVRFETEVYANGTADIKVEAADHTLLDLEGEKLPATLKTKYGNFVLNTTQYYPKDKDVKAIITVTGYDAAAEDLAEDVVSSIASKKSNVIELSIVTPNPEIGTKIINTIIDKYNARGIEQKNLQSSKTAQFIDERLALISGDLAQAEGDIQSYKQGQGIVDVATEATYNVQLKSQAEKSLIQAQTQNEIIRMTRDFLRDPSKAYELIPSTNEIQGVGTAISTYNQLILRRMELMTNARGNNVALKSLTEQIDAMRQSIMTSLDRAYENSNIEIRDLQRQMARAEGKLGNIPTQEREFLNLKRQQEVKQQLYLFLLQRREETAMLLANAVPKGEIIDAAYTLTEPVGMNKKLIVLIALLFGLCIPPVCLYIKKILRTKFETRKEVEDLVDIPVLGEMCTDRSGNALVVSGTNTSATSELFRLMRSNLRYILNRPDDKVVLVTSTRSGEGKSFISINLAASLALLNKKVLLIGMDIRNPQLGHYLGLPRKNGLTNYLSDSNIALDDIIIKQPLTPGLDIIEAGPIPPNPGELLSSDRLAMMIDELRKEYDYIIIDSAPVGMVSDTLTLDRFSDATVYVTRAKHTTISDLKFADRLFEQGRLKRMSLVINGTSAHQGYGYGYKTKG